MITYFNVTLMSQLVECLICIWFRFESEYLKWTRMLAWLCWGGRDTRTMANVGSILLATVWPDCANFEIFLQMLQKYWAFCKGSLLRRKTVWLLFRELCEKCTTFYLNICSWSNKEILAYTTLIYKHSDWMFKFFIPSKCLKYNQSVN